VKKGCANLGRHIENVKSFGVPVVVAINHFVTDTEPRSQAVKDYVAEQGAEAILCKHWAQGSAGIEELAHKVVEMAESGAGAVRAALSRRDAAVREDRDHRQAIYHADEVIADKIRARAAAAMGSAGLRQPAGLHGQDAVFVLDRSEPARRADRATPVPVREVRLSAGAGFIVVICGEIMTMPGLPRLRRRKRSVSTTRARSRGFSERRRARHAGKLLPPCRRRRAATPGSGPDP
jgi:formate--tetrahydrofolate ligase